MDDRVAELEDNLRKVYSVVSMEGGVHMNSIGPAIESQLDSIPLRSVIHVHNESDSWGICGVALDPYQQFCYTRQGMSRCRPRVHGRGDIRTAARD